MEKHLQKILVLVVMIIVLSTIGRRFVTEYKESTDFKESSRRVEAVLIGDGGCSTARSDSKRIGETKKARYYAYIYQNMVVQYELDGQKKEAFIGPVLLYTMDSGTYITDSEIQKQVDRVKYETGETVEVYVDAEGNVRLADEVDEQSEVSRPIRALASIFLPFLLLIPAFLKKRD